MAAPIPREAPVTSATEPSSPARGVIGPLYLGSNTETVLSDDWAGADLVLAPDGNITYPDFGTGEPGTGSIKEIVYAQNAGTPHAAASANPVAGGHPLDVTFIDDEDLASPWGVRPRRRRSCGARCRSR